MQLKNDDAVIRMHTIDATHDFKVRLMRQSTFMDSLVTFSPACQNIPKIHNSVLRVVFCDVGCPSFPEGDLAPKTLGLLLVSPTLL